MPALPGLDPNPKFLNRQGNPAHPEDARLGTREAKFNRTRNMRTHPNATAPGGALGFRLWTQPQEALATRGGVLAVGRYSRESSFVSEGIGEQVQILAVPMSSWLLFRPSGRRHGWP